MTRTVDINELKNSIQAVIALTKDGDEIVLEENGEAVVKITPIANLENKQRIAGLRQGEYWMSDDFGDELPDSFWLGENE